MPQWLTLSAIKDGVIVLAVVLLGWWVYRSGENAVHVRDMKVLQQQIAAMQKQTDQWQSAVEKSNAVKQQDLTAINNGSIIRPIHVELCNQPPNEVLSGSATGSSGQRPEAGRADVRSQQDIGPALQAFERKYESALAECRSVVSSWPSSSSSSP